MLALVVRPTRCLRCCLSGPTRVTLIQRLARSQPVHWKRLPFLLVRQCFLARPDAGAPSPPVAVMRVVRAVPVARWEWRPSAPASVSSRYVLLRRPLRLMARQAASQPLKVLMLVSLRRLGARRSGPSQSSRRALPQRQPYRLLRLLSWRYPVFLSLVRRPLPLAARPDAMVRWPRTLVMVFVSLPPLLWMPTSPRTAYAPLR